MGDKTVEKEFESLKGNLLSLFEGIVAFYKERYEATRLRGEKTAKELSETIKQHPGITALIGGTIGLGLGVLVAKLWYDRNPR